MQANDLDISRTYTIAGEFLKDKNTEVHAIWKEMSPRGECPTVEEAILYLTAMVATMENWGQ